MINLQAGIKIKQEPIEGFTLMGSWIKSFLLIRVSFDQYSCFFFRLATYGKRFRKLAEPLPEMVRTGVGGYSFKMAYGGRLSTKAVPFSGFRYMKGNNDLRGQQWPKRSKIHVHEVFFIKFTWFESLQNFYSQLPRSAVLPYLLMGLNGCIRWVVTVCMTTTYSPLSDCIRLRGALLHGKTVLLQFWRG